MSNTQRPRRSNRPPHLTLVSSGPGAAVSELAEFREHLAIAGAPAEVLQVLDSASDVAEAMQRLADAGLLPGPEDSVAGLLAGWLRCSSRAATR